MKYYCNDCGDTLCVNCVDFPWECPETEICKNCLEEIEEVKRVWVEYIKERNVNTKTT